MSRPVTVGIDVGGTFTDVTIFDRASGRTQAFKALSSREAPETGIIDALKRSGVALADIELIVHGTTVATNALSFFNATAPILAAPIGLAIALRIARVLWVRDETSAPPVRALLQATVLTWVEPSRAAAKRIGASVSRDPFAV